MMLLCCFKPLNTIKNRERMNAPIEELGGYLTVLDKIMCLTVGDKKDPEPWQSPLGPVADEAQPPSKPRRAETIAFECDGSRYQMPVGSFVDGQPREAFLNADRADSLLDVLTSDAAILASQDLQYGAGLDVLRHALKHAPSGMAAKPISAALDHIR
jgi:hypothetical protein